MSGGNCHRHNGGGNANRHVATLIKQDLIQGKVGAESWLPFSLRRGGPPWGDSEGVPVVNCQSWSPVTGFTETCPHSRERGWQSSRIAVPGRD